MGVAAPQGVGDDGRMVFSDDVCVPAALLQVKRQNLMDIAKLFGWVVQKHEDVTRLKERLAKMTPDERAREAERDFAQARQALVEYRARAVAACRGRRLTEPYFEEYLGADPLGTVVSLNLARRHLTEVQRATAAAKVTNNAAWRRRPGEDYTAPRWSLELIGDLIEAGLDAGLVLFTAGRAGDTGRADHLVADLDRQSPLRRDDAG
jgi:hypothetical protein